MAIDPLNLPPQLYKRLEQYDYHISPYIGQNSKRQALGQTSEEYSPEPSMTLARFRKKPGHSPKKYSPSRSPQIKRKIAPKTHNQFRLKENSKRNKTLVTQSMKQSEEDLLQNMQ